MNSSSEVFPRGDMSAYQRWEMASLATGSPDAARAVVDKGVDELAAERARITEEARALGYAAGGARAEAERVRLAVLLDRFDSAACDHEQRLVDEVLDLALVLGRLLVGEALAVRRELVLPVVSAALRQLPQSTQRVQLVLNPADVDLVRRFLSGDQTGSRCHLVASPGIAPGGCRVETEQCDLDATLPTRWKKLLVELGRTDGWLEPT